MTAKTPLTLINAFEVLPHEDEQFVAAWSRARDLLAPQPGYGGATLHGALAPDARFRYVNLGHWQTLDHFRAATETAGIRADNFPFPAHPGLYQVVTSEQRLSNGTSSSVTLINLFEVEPDEDEQFIAGWQAAREQLNRRPGYLDTTLHRAIQPDVDFRFVNVAHWASADAFQAAITNRAFRAVAHLPYPGNPSLYQPVAYERQ
jgi:heme-degrading monooxygenase HmoA